MASLTQQLKALKDQLEAGQPPDPDALKKLSDTIDALAALLPAASPGVSFTPAAIEPSASTDISVGAISGTPASNPAQPVLPPTLPLPAMGTSDDAGASNSTAQTDTSATTSNSAPASATASSAPPQQKTVSADTTALATLASKLQDLSQSLAPTAPDLSQKLAALSQTVTTTASDPTAVAQLNQQLAASGTTITDAVKPLLPTPPAASPSIASTQPQLAAATTALPLPAVSSPEDKPATEKPAPSKSADATATTKLSVTSTTTASASVVAAASANTKSDATASNDSNTPTAGSDPGSTASSTSVAANAAAAAAPTTDTSSAKPLPAAYQSASNPINMGQVAFEMARQFQQGSSRFTIRLDPPELGRVDVKMHVDATGTVNARLTVERAETLDMFQRDRSSLERALSQAGVDSGKTNLEFSLRQNPFAGMTGGNQQQASTPNSGARFSLSAADDDTATIPAITLYRGIASAGGVNLFV